MFETKKLDSCTPTLRSGDRCGFVFQEVTSITNDTIHISNAFIYNETGVQPTVSARLWCKKQHANILFYDIIQQGTTIPTDVTKEQHMAYLSAFREIVDKCPPGFLAKLTSDKFIVRYFNIPPGSSTQTIRDMRQLVHIEKQNRSSCDAFVKSNIRLFQADIMDGIVRLLFTQNPVHVSKMEYMAEVVEAGRIEGVIDSVIKHGVKLQL